MSRCSSSTRGTRAMRPVRSRPPPGGAARPGRICRPDAGALKTFSTRLKSATTDATSRGPLLRRPRTRHLPGNDTYAHPLKKPSPAGRRSIAATCGCRGDESDARRLAHSPAGDRKGSGAAWGSAPKLDPEVIRERSGDAETTDCPVRDSGHEKGRPWAPLARGRVRASDSDSLVGVHLDGMYWLLMKL